MSDTKYCDSLFMPVRSRILSIERETDAEWSFLLEWTGARPDFGQFFQVSIPGFGEAPISVSGVYPIIASNGECERIEVTVRKVGRLTGALFDRRVGDSIWLRGPYGRAFSLDQFREKHLVIAAGGSGVAPVRTLIRYLYGNLDVVPRLDLLLGFKTPAALLFRREIEIWQTANPATHRVHLTVDEGTPEWQGKTGLITALIPSLELPDLNRLNVVIVGPPTMMKYAALAFLARSVPEEALWFSFERHMSCGVGKCGHCKIDDKYVCLDGPVFSHLVAKTLID